jgi:hypothetical protein
MLFSSAGVEWVRVSRFLTLYDSQMAGPLARAIRLDWFLGVHAG